MAASAGATPTTSGASMVSLRVQDVPRGSSGMNPIPGLRKVPLLPFETAAQLAAMHDTEFAQHLADLTHRLGFGRIYADNHLAHPPPYRPGTVVPAGEPLSREEIIAIHMYTQDSDFCRILNARLRTEDRAVLVPFLPLLKLLLTALYKLPQVSGPVYRGVKGDLRADFVKNTTKVWWAFSSTSTDLEVLANNTFAGYAGQRTFFYIHACAAFDVGRYSAFPEERELLLAPGSTLKITGVFSPHPDIHNITMMQEPFVPLPLVEDELSELRALLAQSKGAVAAAQAESASLRDQLQAQQAQIAQLRASGGGSAASAALVAEVERLKQAVTSSERAHQALQAKHASCESDKAARIAEIERLKKEMASAEKARQALRRDHEQLKQTAEIAKKAQAALQAEIEQLKQAAKGDKAPIRPASGAAASVGPRQAPKSAAAKKPVGLFDDSDGDDNSFQDQVALQAQIEQMKQVLKAGQAPIPRPASAAAASAGARQAPQSAVAKVPNLDALSPPPRTIPNTKFKVPLMICEARNTPSPSVIVADWDDDDGPPAPRVPWRNL